MEEKKSKGISKIFSKFKSSIKVSVGKDEDQSDKFDNSTDRKNDVHKDRNSSDDRLNVNKATIPTRKKSGSKNCTQDNSDTEVVLRNRCSSHADLKASAYASRENVESIIGSSLTLPRIKPTGVKITPSEQDDIYDSNDDITTENLISSTEYLQQEDSSKFFD